MPYALLAVVYSTNGLIRVSVKLTANHGGRHSFRVCPSTTPSDVCFGNNFLTAEGNPSGGANPVNGKRYWYIPNPAGTGSFSSQWRLPAGVSCANGCILQWKWAAYQTCALPCESPSVDDMSKVRNSLEASQKPYLQTGSILRAPPLKDRQTESLASLQHHNGLVCVRSLL